MTPILEAEANLTAQNQITIPAPIRKALKLRAGESRVKFRVTSEKGRVVVVLVGPPATEKEDPALRPFLNLLTKDIRENPQRIRPFPVDLLNRGRSVVENVEVDLDGPLTGEE
jgi:antitoxin PrlF